MKLEPFKSGDTMKELQFKEAYKRIIITLWPIWKEPVYPLSGEILHGM